MFFPWVRAFGLAARVLTSRALYCLAAAVLATPSCSRTERTRRPDVVLITIDTLRADRVGPRLTPALERLASEGVRFTRAYTVAPLTLPAHTTMMTGVLPPVHGVRENGVPFRGDRPTLASVFREAGYGTAAFVGAYVLNRRFGLDRDFEHYDDQKRLPGAVDRYEVSRPADEVIDAVLRWAASTARADTRPFFLWVHLYDPHQPYTPPASWRSVAGSEYDGEVAFADSQVDRLLKLLETVRPGRPRIVAVTADHGESLGEHGEDGHGVQLYEAVARVPLILHAPRLRPHTSNRVASLADLAPTLLLLAGVQAPDGMGERSLLTLGGKSVAYVETVYPRVLGGSDLRALVQGSWKLLLSEEVELYDVERDREEALDVAARRPDVVRRMEARLKPLQRSMSTVAVPAGTRRGLQALGYFSGAPPLTGVPPLPRTMVLRAWKDFTLAYRRLAEDRPSDARAILERLVDLSPNAVLFQRTLARALNAAGNSREAERRIREALRRWPRDPVLLYEFGLALQAHGRGTEALAAYRASILADPTYAPALLEIGRLLLERGQTGEARVMLEHAAELDPADGRAHALLSGWERAAAGRRP